MNEIGIVSYGGSIPRMRIKADEIAKVWGKQGELISKGLGIFEKSVPSIDQDTATISVEAARAALKRSMIDPKDIGAIYIGSESHPYAVKPTGTIVGEAIGATPDLMVADYEFACKAGTAGIQSCTALVKAGFIRYGLAIGADTSQAAPGDALEYSASAGGAAFLIGSEQVIAMINKTYSYTTDTPDFWRRAERKYPKHGGRFTGEPAYFKHVSCCAQKIMEQVGTTPKDYQYAVFHQPNGKFPQKIAKIIGFTPEQIKDGLIVPFIGNTYSGSSCVGLAAVLDVASPGDRILVTSYGSGAGSDGFDIIITDEISNFKKENAPTIMEIVNDKTYIDYGEYAKITELLIWEG
jgi:hydroxymethylglutaryl-CoA synthase